MIVAIVGSRAWDDYWAIQQFVKRLARKYPDAVVVSGGARGVDITAETAAGRNDLDVISYRPYEYENMHYRVEFSIETVTSGDRAQEIVVAKSRRINPPYFETYAQAAFFRNGWIVDDADRVVTFWDGKSHGTLDTIRKANAAGKPLHHLGASP